MKKLLLVCVLLWATLVTGEALICNTCRFGIADRCLFGSTEACSDSQPNCYMGNLGLNISGLVNLQTRGCLASSLCNQTESVVLLGVGYTNTKTCCSTDLCNGATSGHLSLTAALATALMAVWSNVNV